MDDRSGGIQEQGRLQNPLGVVQFPMFQISIPQSTQYKGAPRILPRGVLQIRNRLGNLSLPQV